MAADYLIDVNARIVYVRLCGVVTAAELNENRLRMIDDPAFDPTFSELVDARLVTTLALSGEHLRELAQASVFAEVARRAFVVPNNVHFGLVQMFQIHRVIAGGHEAIQTFTDAESATKWLGLASDYSLGAAGFNL
jgi:hypothetical protein